MSVVQSLSRDDVSNDPAAPVLVLVKVDEVVIRDSVRAPQDNAIIPAASMVVVALIHRHGG
jgi:hypothetical protein